VGVPKTGGWREILNTDSTHYGGSNVGNGLGPTQAQSVPAHGHGQSIAVTLPPLATVIFEPV
jgi:1,4-alpha-glucan branching enzyme